MKAVIDRIEGRLSVLSVGDDSIKLKIALSLLPMGIWRAIS